MKTLTATLFALLMSTVVPLFATEVKLTNGNSIDIQIVEPKYSEVTCIKDDKAVELKYSDIDMNWLRFNQPQDYKILLEGRNKKINESNARICIHLSDVLIDKKYGPNKRLYFNSYSYLQSIGGMAESGSTYEALLKIINAKPGSGVNYDRILNRIMSSRKSKDALTGVETNSNYGIITEIQNDESIIKSHGSTQEFISRINKIHKIIQNANVDVQDAIKRKDTIEEIDRKAQKENIRKELIDLAKYVESLGVEPFVEDSNLKGK